MKKWPFSVRHQRRKALLKLLLIMKLIVFLLVIGSVELHATGYAQVKLSLNLQHVDIKKALLTIQKKSPYRFMYNDDLLPRDARVTIQTKEAGIDEVLNMIFASTSLTYTILKNNLVVISSLEKKDDIQVTVSGTVQLRDRDGQMSRRANITVIEKGTSRGTVTDENGAFSLAVTNTESILVISYVGYRTIEFPLAGKTTVNIVLDIQENQLQDVVVTALGITRQKKSLTYATQTLKGSDVSDTREVNITNAMDGKVANMTISKTNAGPGSSNRIIFRGNRSITGDNQPLVIVDGVRIDNTPKAFTDVTGNIQLSRDNGDGISNINPDDIESVTVLTGASAAALYGSDASNGAIIVTTKKGRYGNGIGIQISSSVNMENPLILPKYQNVYGQGIGGDFALGSDQSWGAKMAGQPILDWTGKTQAFSPQPDNVKDFFQTGTELINSIAISAGNEKSQTYFSYTNTSSRGIIPNNTYKRNNLNLRQTTLVAKNLTLDLKANYLVEDIGNRPFAGAANHALVTILSMPRSLRISDIRNYETIDPTDLSLKQNYWASSPPNFQNPYWSAYRDLYDRIRNRFIGLVSLKYQITLALSVQARTSLDYYTDASQEEDYSGSFWLTKPGGNYVINKESNRQFNNDLLISYVKDLSSNFNLNLNAGVSIEQFNFENTNTNSGGLNIANGFFLGNALSPVSTNSIARTEKQSVYASAELGFKDYLFLDLTGRNDWNSTLPVQNNSYFFPSVGLSGVINEMVSLPVAISLLKVRASYAFVGNGTAFNQIKPSPTLQDAGNGGFLLVDRILHDANLKPEETHSFETGLELGLFKNRFGAEFTFYHTNTINQILQIGVPNPSGYAFRIINAGNIRNQGVELLLNGKPVDGHDFKWTISVNFGLNRNKIIALDSLQKMPPLSSPETLGLIVAEEGEAYGGIYTTSYQRNSSGQIMVDNTTGLPLVEGDQTKYFAGNYNPDWTGGITNTFQYKRWSFSVLIDERKGGIIISGTQALLASNGVSQITEANRETGFVVPNSIKEDGTKNDIVVAPQDYWQYIGKTNLVGEQFVNSATNIRLREASLSYGFPANIIGKTFIKGISLTAIGRNLFFLKNNANGFDPETALGTGNNQGLEYASLPSTRSYGFYLKLNF
jgi:TonB-linked SusC/RagA family outer membrane protein